MNITKEQLMDLADYLPPECEVHIRENYCLNAVIKEPTCVLIGDFDWEPLKEAWKQAGLPPESYPQKRYDTGLEFIYY